MGTAVGTAVTSCHQYLRTAVGDGGLGRGECGGANTSCPGATPTLAATLAATTLAAALPATTLAATLAATTLAVTTLAATTLAA